MRFGVAAVDLIAAGGFGMMVALHGDSIVSVDVAQAVGHLKSVNPNGEVVRTARAIGIGSGTQIFPSGYLPGLRVTLVTSRRCPLRVLIQRHFRVGIIPMNDLGLCLVGQLCLAFGVAGLFWPEKLTPLFFEVLMFPWVASYRGIRANSIAAIGLSLLLFARLLAGIR